jgi:superfamily II DNA or RNA helicase
MPNRTSPTGSELFIVDNSDADWKVLRYLHDWCQISKSIDIATGYFEIGSLLTLKDEWQKVDRIRILMGDEVSLRTQAAFAQGLASVTGQLDASIEREKEKNDFLSGVPAIVDALRSGKITCRVYRKEKFHAKAYITHARMEVVGSFALVGSSNFTSPGLTENVELNVQISGRPVTVLQEWYDEHWDAAEDVTAEVLRTVERHTREYPPFDIYAKALHEYFRGHEMTAGEWELAGPAHGGSHMYSVLDHYQREGYRALMKISAQHGGAFLCDGVGLGKTFVGLMLIERLIRDRKNVALFVPKAAREDVWERDIERYLPHLSSAIYSRLSIFNHTDLLRAGRWQKHLDRVKEVADAIVIDEAHHFRNTGVKGEEGEIQSRYWRLYEIVQGKRLFMLTATPINNRLTDLQHMIELFTQRQPDAFRNSLGIHSIPGHFRSLEKALEQLVRARQTQEFGDLDTNQAEAEQVLWSDDLFRALVVQRSRAYVKQSQRQHGGTRAIFPVRQAPQVAHYSITKTYGPLLQMIEDAFKREKPLFSLAIYYPLAYCVKTDMDKQQRAWVEGRQKQVVLLIRTQFLKRFESSARAFEYSCQALLLKLLAWAEKHSQTEEEIGLLTRWKNQNAKLLESVHADQHELNGQDYDEESDENLIDDELLEAVEPLPRDEYRIGAILSETFLDLNQIVAFLRELRKFSPARDDKLKTLIRLLRSDPVLSKHKVLIFSEYMATARYVRKQLEEAGFTNVDEVDSGTKRSRSEIIRRFAPYYNRPAQGELFDGLDEQTRILVSTDVLSEGLNLQDATRLINYDLHWNPVRLMQRIGRVDRRLNPDIEEQMLADHPELRGVRGAVAYWNFLPPEELDRLLFLYGTVSHKTLRISKVFGIEGKKLLKPEDDYEALKDFNHAYEGETSGVESMRLEYQKLLQDYPDLLLRLQALPGRVFSGKAHPKPDSKAVFFCYALPARTGGVEEKLSHSAEWSLDNGSTRWYLYDLAMERILEEPGEIVGLIRCLPDTPRQCTLARPKLAEVRTRIEKHIRDSYLKQVQAPLGVKPALRAWMELS